MSGGRVLVLTARCLHPGCDWTPTGEPDLAARRHTGGTGIKGDGANPPTLVEGRPATTTRKDTAA